MKYTKIYIQLMLSCFLLDSREFNEKFIYQIVIWDTNKLSFPENENSKVSFL